MLINWITVEYMKDPINLKTANSGLCFVDYFGALETNLGLLYMPIDKYAKSPKTIVKSEGLFGPFTQKIAIDIFKNNKCKSMRSLIFLFPTLDVLGMLHWKLEGNKNTDKATLDFLESIGEATISILDCN